jgi:hypothetical protein
VITSSAYCRSAKKIKTKRMNLKGPDDVRCLRARWILRQCRTRTQRAVCSLSR